MANSANPEINKKIATSALGTLVIATVFFYLGDRYAETLVTYPGQIFDHLSDAFLSMWQTIKDAPFALDMTSNSLLFGGACFLIIWMIWLRYVAFIGNYRSGEESGSARWGTVKEGKKFKDLQTEDNNLLFTKNFGLALHRPKFDPEYDRNLNVLVVGGSGSGKTFNYVTPNICQLNTSYFVTDPKGTLLKDAGYLFTDNGYKLKSFNTINLDESMHHLQPLRFPIPQGRAPRAGTGSPCAGDEEPRRALAFGLPAPLQGVQRWERDRPPRHHPAGSGCARVRDGTGRSQGLHRHLRALCGAISSSRRVRREREHGKRGRRNA